MTVNSTDCLLPEQIIETKPYATIMKIKQTMTGNQIAEYFTTKFGDKNIDPIDAAMHTLSAFNAESSGEIDMGGQYTIYTGIAPCENGYKNWGTALQRATQSYN